MSALQIQIPNVKTIVKKGKPRAKVDLKMYEPIDITYTERRFESRQDALYNRRQISASHIPRNIHEARQQIHRITTERRRGKGEDKVFTVKELKEICKNLGIKCSSQVKAVVVNAILAKLNTDDNDE